MSGVAEKKRLEKSFGLDFNQSLGNIVYTSDQSTTAYLVTKTSKVLFEGSGANSQQSGFQDHGTGILLAIAVISQTREQYMDQIIAFFSEYDTFVSAIVGTLVGGLITFGIQAYALRVRRKQREEDLRRTQQILGHSLIIKMIKINSNFRDLHKHFEECVMRSKTMEYKAEPWQYYSPLATLPNSVFFSSEEMSMLIAMNNDEVFNLVFPLDTVHNTLLATIARRQEEQAILHDRLKFDAFSGEIGAVDLVHSEIKSIQGKFILINNEFDQLRDNSKDGHLVLQKALCDLRRLLSDKLGIRIDLEEE